MRRVAIVFFTMVVSGCTSLAGECERVLSEGDWSQVEEPASFEILRDSTESEGEVLVYINRASGVVAACRSCAEASSRVESVSYIEHGEVSGVTTKSCGPY